MRCESLVRLIMVVRSQPGGCAFPLGFKTPWLLASSLVAAVATPNSAARPNHRCGAAASGGAKRPLRAMPSTSP